MSAVATSSSSSNTTIITVVIHSWWLPRLYNPEDTSVTWGVLGAEPGRTRRLVLWRKSRATVPQLSACQRDHRGGGHEARGGGLALPGLPGAPAAPRLELVVFTFFLFFSPFKQKNLYFPGQKLTRGPDGQRHIRAPGWPRPLPPSIPRALCPHPSGDQPSGMSGMAHQRALEPGPSAFPLCSGVHKAGFSAESPVSPCPGLLRHH